MQIHLKKNICEIEVLRLDNEAVRSKTGPSSALCSLWTIFLVKKKIFFSLKIVSLLFSVFARGLQKSLVAGSHPVTILAELSSSSDDVCNDFKEGIGLKAKTF